LKKGTLLTEIPGFSSQHVGKLGGYSINTAEEFVALTNTDERRRLVGDLLGLDEKNLADLIALVKSHLPEAVRREMETPVDTSLFGTGAREPEPRSEADDRTNE
jgi:hypothetical protein